MAPKPPTINAPAPAHRLRRCGHGARACSEPACCDDAVGNVREVGDIDGATDAGNGGPGSGFSAARIVSGVNGGERKRTPVASKIALAMAAVPGTEADSPAPSIGSPGRGISSTSMTGTSRKLMIG